MSHQVESMFFTGQTPWHGLGVRLEDNPTIEQAITAAGLDWEVGLESLFTADLVEITLRANRRKSDNAILGYVGPDYCPLQNRAAFEWFQPFIASGEARLATAGSLRGGRNVWVLAEILRDPMVIVPKADDTVKKYLLLSHAHDGSSAAKIKFSPIRVVCANTLAMAFADKAGSLMSVRHTKNMADSMAKVRDLVNLADQSFESSAEQYRRLVAKNFTESDLRRYVQMVFAPQKTAARASTAMVVASREPEVIEGEFIEDEKDAAKPRSRVFCTIQRLFETGKGNTLDGVRGTGWAAYNAITEYLSHYRGTDADRRAHAMAFNQGARLNAQALKIGLQMAG